MSSFRLSFLFLTFSFSFLSHLAFPAAGQDAPLYHICDDSNYTANSTYESNLNQVLSTLAADGASTGFLNDTVGQVPNKVYAFSLCRGDTNASLCGSCLDNAQQDVLQACPYSKGATIWYPRCELSFSYQRSFTGSDQMIIMSNVNNVTDVGLFNVTVAELLSNITSWAAFNATKNFATGAVNFTAELPTMYGLVQCTPYLTASQCQQCLQGLFDPLPEQMAGKKGGRVLSVNCNFRFEVYAFYDGSPMLRLATPRLVAPPQNNMTAPSPVQPPPVRGEGKKKNATVKILAIVIPVVFAVLMIFVICICFLRRKPAQKYPHHHDGIERVDSLLFSLHALKEATANFSEENKLGEGGFGAVYKGFLPDGREIAVKKLLTSSGEGIEELKNELVLVANLQHRNLVRLLGVCFEEEKLIVYEYVPNRSLDTFLFDIDRRALLSWRVRYKIIAGIARGLLYLHEESQLRIIHRDLKASNILLDSDMNPKIADFGLARLFGRDQTQGTTSRVVGTYGYMAPEYVMRGQFSVKSDIFSFGILVLEIMTGRKNSGSIDSEDDEDVLSYVWERWSKGEVSDILDHTLGENSPRDEILRCIQLGLLCVQENPSSRPSMSAIIVMLNSVSVSLEAPTGPAFLVGRSSMKSIDYSTSEGANGYNSPYSRQTMPSNEVSISEIEPR